MSERIDIEITDNISPAPRKKIIAIADAAIRAGDAVDRLKKMLASVSVSAIDKLNSAVKRAALTEQKLALANQKLKTEIERTTAANFRAEQSFNAAAAAENRAAMSANKLADSQFKASVSAQKLVTEQQRSAEAVSKAMIAEDRLADSKIKSLITSEKLTLANQKAQTEIQKTNLVKQQGILVSERAKLTEQNFYIAMRKTATAAIGESRALVQLSTAKIQNTINATRATIAELRLGRAIDSVGRSAKKASINILGFLSKAALIAGVVGTTAVVITKSVDAYTNLQNKLRIVTETEGQLAQVSREVFQIARNTRAPVQDTAKAFQRFDLAMVQLGASQRESLQLTETVNKALIISGSSSGEAGAALLQLSQAFNKGKLDGDEFRSVMELMPPVADAIAKQLGVTRGELLKLAPQGKITADVMRKAFAAARVEIADKFAKTLPTIGQGFTVLGNAATEAFGEFDKAFLITSSVASAMLLLADGITNSIFLFKALSIVIKDAFSAANILKMPDIIKKVFSQTSKNISTILKIQLTGIKNFVNITIGMFVSAFNTIVAIWKNFTPIMENTFKSVANFAVSAAEAMVNAFGEGIRKLDELQAKVTGKRLLSDDFLKVDFSQFLFEVDASAATLGSVINDEFTKALNVDYLGNFADKVSTEMDKLKNPPDESRGESSPSPLGDPIKFLETWQLTVNQLGDTFADFFKNITDGFADSFSRAIVYGDNLGESLKNVAKGAMADLISSLVKLGIQQVVLSATGSAAATAATAVGVASATTLAQAYAPAATLASLASFGANAVPASAGIASTSAISQAIASKASVGTALGGYKSGGFTGMGSVDEPAGIVHRKEFVSRADVTSRNRPALEAMERGAVFTAEGNRVDSKKGSSDTKIESHTYIVSEGMFNEEELVQRWTNYKAMSDDRNYRRRG